MVRDEIRKAITQALNAAQQSGRLAPFALPAVDVQRPKQADHGDYATNVAMVAAAALKKAGTSANPREIAQAIADYVPADGPIGSVEIAGPGFINIRLADRWLQQQTSTIVAEGPEFGHFNRGNGARWMVEFVSANPTGPIHYGGARNAALGDSLANCLSAAGYAVSREFYVNDAGTQFNIFAATLYARYAQLLGRDEPLPADGYQGEYMLGYAQNIIAEHGDRFLQMDKADAIEQLKPLSEAQVLTGLEQELGSMGVYFDRWFREQDLYTSGLVQRTLDRLQAQDDLVHKDGALWFRASKYAKVDKDEVVIRSSGAPTYFASDIAYHYNKFVERGYERVINVLAVDHQGHVPRMAAVMSAIGQDPAKLTLLLYNLVRLVRDGQEVRMSKRKGNLLTIGEVVEDVGKDAVRFNLLTRSPESTIDFDLDLAIQESNDNPVFYVQYGHARICSILAKAGDEQAIASADGDVNLLNHPAELTLLRKLLELEEQIELAIDKLSPHNLTHYAVALTQVFNAFYRDCRVIDPDRPALSQARLLLARAAQVGLQNVLALLGVSAPTSM